MNSHRHFISHAGLVLILAAGIVSFNGHSTRAAYPTTGQPGWRLITPPPTVFLSVNPITVTSSTTKKLMMNLSADSFQPRFHVGLSTGSATGLPQETHSWEFNLSASSFSYSKASGKAQVMTGTQINPFGTAALTFTRKSSKKVACSSGVEVIQTGTVTGTTFFNTNSSSWGSVGSKTAKINKPATVTYDNACIRKVPTLTPACSTGFTWNTPTASLKSGGQNIVESMAGGLDTYGFGSAPDLVSGTRTINLIAPKGSTRSDIAYEASPAPTLKNTVLTITTSAGSSLIVGGATTKETGSPYSPGGTACKSGKKTKTETLTYYLNVPWANMTKSPLTVHLSIGGNFSIKNGKGASITIHSYA